MPVDQHRGYFNVGDAMQDFRQAWAGSWYGLCLGQYSEYELGIIDVDDHPAFHIRYGDAEFPDGQTEHTYVILSMDTFSKMTLNEILKAPGWCGIMQAGVNVGTEGNPTLEAMHATWALNWVPFWTQAIEVLTGCETGTPTDATSEMSPTTVLTSMVAVPCTTDAQAQIGCESAVIWAGYNPTTGVNWIGIGTLTSPFATPTNMLTMGPIVDPLQQIADGEIDVSINHGANMYSMRSRVRTGP